MQRFLNLGAEYRLQLSQIEIDSARYIINCFALA